MLSIRTQLIVPYSCKFAIVPLFLSRYIYRLWPSRCTINAKGIKKVRWSWKKYEDLGLYCKKKTLKKDLFSKWLCSSVMKMSTLWWERRTGCVLYHRFWMLWKNKRLQCKAKTHISERPYFYKKTVSVSLFSPCGLLLVKIMILLNNDDNYTLEQKNTYKRVFLLLLYFRAMHTKSPKCRVVRERWLNT